MKTNFPTKKYLVLTNPEEKAIAIIECEVGLYDISKKVKQAISEEEDLESIELINDFTIDFYGLDYPFEASVQNVFEKNKIKKHYKLTETTLY